MSRVFSLTIKNRVAAIGVSVLIVGVGVVLVMFGMALLAGLAITGAVVGAGAAIYRSLRRGSDSEARQRLGRDAGLDPSLEVRPARPAVIEPPRTLDK